MHVCVCKGGSILVIGMYVYIFSCCLFQHYQRLYQAVLSVQQWYRCWYDTRKARRYYLDLRRASIMTQAAWRGQLVRRQIEVRRVKQILHAHVHVHMCTLCIYRRAWKS